MFSSEPKSYSRVSERNRLKKRPSLTSSEPKESPPHPPPRRESNLLAVIVDNGAHTIKVGLSSQASPSIVPNCIMKAKAERKRLFVGDQITECRDCSGLYFLLPCERGYVTKWDVQKPVWDHVFTKSVCPINDNPVVVTQPLFNFKSIQDCMDEIFFEEYEVSSMFRLCPTDLAALKFMEDKKPPRSTFIVVDSGFSFTHVVPYIAGNKFLHGIRRLNVGGKLLTNHLKDIISYRQYNVMEETYVINQVKEDTCYVAMNVKDELKVAGSTSSIVRNYVLPDFNNIRRGYIQKADDDTNKELEENCQILRLNNERFIVPEILFHPSDIGMKSMGIAEVIVRSIRSCPSEHQEDLARNILLIGGNCKFPGFKDRIYSDVRSQLPHLWEVNVYLPDDPIAYSWKGGRALMRVPNFKSFLVTKAEYEELGSSIIQQRFNTWMTDGSPVVDEVKKDREEYRYLDKLKGRHIFGKQDSTVTEDSGATSASVNVTDEPDSSQDSEETSQDEPCQSIDAEGGSRTRRGSGRTDGDDDSLRLFCETESTMEDDLRNSVELFPFDTEMYL